MLKEKILENLTTAQKYSILLLYACNSEPVKGKLWYQKELFLLSQNFPELKEESDFEEDLMGPYSETADEELEQLELTNIIKKRGSRLELTAFGKELAKEIESTINEQGRELISDLKTFLNDLSQDELFGFIYFSYPHLTKESIKVKKLLPRRKQIGISLYRKNKISLGKAAEIAGLSIEDFIRELRSKGINIYV